MSYANYAWRKSGKKFKASLSRSMQYSVKLLENGRTHVQITNGNEK